MKLKLLPALLPVALVAGGLAIGAAASPAQATITVTETASELNADGDCSLLEALEALNTGMAVDACPAPTDSVIALPAGSYDVGALAEVHVDATIVGAGAGATVLDCSNAAAACLNNLGVGSSLTIESLTMANAPGTLVNQPFGAGPLVITDSVLDGSGLYGAASGDSSVTIVRTSIVGTASAGVGTDSGDIVLVDSKVADTGGFAVASQAGDITMSRSSVSGNDHPGVYDKNGDVHVEFSTINDNGGSGIETVGGSVSVQGSTIARNKSKAIKTTDGDLTIESSTIVQNEGRAFDYSGNGSIYVANSIMANEGEECDNPMVSGGNNIADDDLIGCTFDHPTDRVDVDPMLSELGDHGGPTLTYLPLAGSPAIDRGAGCPATDQRGLVRPADGTGDGAAVCDIGAVEVQPADLPEEPTPPSDDPAEPAQVSPVRASRVVGQPRFTG
jgi:hypothetical protein